MSIKTSIIHRIFPLLDMPDFSLLFLYMSLFISLFFEVFLLITYLEVRDEMKFEEEHLGKEVKHFPSVTVVVPCFNEERTVVATVNSLLSLDYPKDKLRVMVVDDGSKDKTLEVVRQFESHPQVDIYTKPNGGKHTALNFALERINTDLVGGLDADSFVNPDALRRIVPYFDDESIMAVIPSIKVHEPKNVLQYIQKVEYSWGVFLRRMLSSIGALYVTPGPFSIFRTQVFRDLGGYRNAHMTEDMEMAMRMQKNRYRIVNSHSAHVYTVTPSKFGALVTQRTRWTYGFLNNVIDYKGLLFNKSYGHIGIFVLPIATISIFTALYAFANLLWSGSTKAVKAFEKYQAVGMSWKMPELSFDWYFINTGTLSVIVALIMTLTITLLFVSLKVSNGKAKISKELVYYLTLYMFIVPFWLMKAVFNTVFRRKVIWR